MSTLEPMRAEHHAQLWRLLCEFSHQTLGDLCPKNQQEADAKIAADIANGSKFYAIVPDSAKYRDNTLLIPSKNPIGFVWAEAVGDSMAFGHLVFEREGVSSWEKVAATRAAIKQFFADGFRKVIWMYFADNRAFRIFLKKVGAVEEGLFRQHTRRQGELVDAAFMASFPEQK